MPRNAKVCLMLMLCPLLSWAMPTATVTPTVGQLQLVNVGGPSHCPNVTTLRKNPQHYWQGPQGWKSYVMSFSKRLTHLVGVQWQGNKVGKIFCVYKDNSKLTFPVNLQGPGLYLAPKVGPQWRAEKGVIVCTRTALQKCQFQEVRQKTKAIDSSQDVESLLQGIKKGVAGDNN